MPPVPPIQPLSSSSISAIIWPDDILYKADRMSMAHSLEVRPPFLDHRIVEFAASLPEDYKLRGSRLKFLLKELMKGQTSRGDSGRKKVGFDIPAHEWFRGVLKPLLLDTLTEQAVKRHTDFSLGRRASRHQKTYGTA